MSNWRLVLAAVCGMSFAAPASAATFGDLVQWCAPEDAGGRPGLCAGYLETYLAGLASTNVALNDGVRACVPESEDRARILELIEDFARSHPESLADSGVGGLGRALKDLYPCP
jgi:hypothetical protein